MSRHPQYRKKHAPSWLLLLALCVGTGCNLFSEVEDPVEVDMSMAEPDMDGKDGSIPGQIRFVSLTSGVAHTCGIDDRGTTFCWGKNDGGQVGLAAEGFRAPLLDELGLGRRHTCGRAGSSVYCWGSNSTNQLGLGSDRNNANSPARLAADVDFVSVRSGEDFACGRIRLDDGVVCWGDNSDGQAAPTDERTDSIEFPTIVEGVSSVSALSLGGGHACVVSAGNVDCWGRNKDGQQGRDPADSPVDVNEVPGLTGVVDVVAGASHTCVLDETGGVRCWGSNASGQLGSTDFPNSPNFQPQVVDIPVRLDSFGETLGDATCAISINGTAVCWGDNSEGQIDPADPADFSEAVELDFDRPLVAVSVGASHICFLDLDGAVTCQGANANGQTEVPGL